MGMQGVLFPRKNIVGGLILRRAQPGPVILPTDFSRGLVYPSVDITMGISFCNILFILAKLDTKLFAAPFRHPA